MEIVEDVGGGMEGLKKAQQLFKALDLFGRQCPYVLRLSLPGPRLEVVPGGEPLVAKS